MSSTPAAWGLSWNAPVPPSSAYDAATDSLTITCAPDTDAWQRTHYGFSRDNVHFASERREGDFTATVTVSGSPKSRYDQAGLFVRLSPSCWLKCSAEYIPDAPSHLGSVVTNCGFSDWATEDVSSEALASGAPLSVRIRREGPDYFVEKLVLDASTGKERWSQLRMARLLEDTSGNASWCGVDVGVYACSPMLAGEGHVAPYTVTFSAYSCK
jgi:regulation of enolase protein 1 (concanavalin A-like superfamily)